MAEDMEIVPIELEGGKIVYAQVTALGGKQPIGYDLAQFKEFTETLGEIAESIVTNLKKAKPRRGSVEFGLEIGVESGQLTALLVKGTGTASMKITLEWGDLDTATMP
jgi:Trypsin-co-occurring domain 1